MILKQLHLTRINHLKSKNMSKMNSFKGWNIRGYFARRSAQSYFNSNKMTFAAADGGSSCGAGDGKPEPKPSACGSSCGSDGK